MGVGVNSKEEINHFQRRLRLIASTEDCLEDGFNWSGHDLRCNPGPAPTVAGTGSVKESSNLAG
jgi:hypothetical protein